MRILLRRKMMPDKTYYLVDLENVGLEGIHTKERLPEEDIIHIFSTVNGPKMDITTLARLDRNTLAFHEVPPGKQSLDMHLVSYLGFLIRGDPLSHFIIVSKDRDYDDVLAFWNSSGVSVSRRDMIQEAIKSDGTKTKTKVEKKTRSEVEIREEKVRNFIEANFQGKKYKTCKDEMVKAVLDAKTRTQVNSSLTKIFSGSELKEAYGRLKPLIADMPGQ